MTNSSSPSNIPEVRGLPYDHKVSPDGTKERWFDGNGDPFKDRHYTDHNNSGEHTIVPHDQYWEKWPDGKWHLNHKAFPPTDNDIPIPPKMVNSTPDYGTGVLIGVSFIAGYYIIKWELRLQHHLLLEEEA